MTHDALDAWLDQLEAYTSDAPTRREISERFLQTPHALLSSLPRNDHPPGHHQFDIQERATRLGADLPFGLSADQFAHLTSVSASPHFIHDTERGRRDRHPGSRDPRRRGDHRRIDEARKLICHVRLKRSGAWWLEANGHAMLRLRCAIYNGTFDQIFADYMAAHGLKHTALRTNAERSPFVGPHSGSNGFLRAGTVLSNFTPEDRTH